ncbi:hypothetical protein SNEBB_009315 [Seison nebaliae]|nr:hypothetical protein SNEBB_009315 [Seison nebaliae]
MTENEQLVVSLNHLQMIISRERLLREEAELCSKECETRIIHIENLIQTEKKLQSNLVNRIRMLEHSLASVRKSKCRKSSNQNNLNRDETGEEGEAENEKKTIPDPIIWKNEKVDGKNSSLRIIQDYLRKVKCPSGLVEMKLRVLNEQKLSKSVNDSMSTTEIEGDLPERKIMEKISLKKMNEMEIDEIMNENESILTSPKNNEEYVVKLDTKTDVKEMEEEIELEEDEEEIEQNADDETFDSKLNHQLKKKMKKLNETSLKKRKKKKRIKLSKSSPPSSSSSSSSSSSNDDNFETNEIPYDDQEIGKLPAPTSIAIPRNEEVRKAWKMKFVLRQHSDSVRSISFHRSEPLLISGSDDGTIRLWELIEKEKGECTELHEAVRCYRNDCSDVLSTRFLQDPNLFVSSGLQGNINFHQLYMNNDGDDDLNKLFNSSSSNVQSINVNDYPIFKLITNERHPFFVSLSANRSLHFWKSISLNELNQFDSNLMDNVQLSQFNYDSMEENGQIVDGCFANGNSSDFLTVFQNHADLLDCETMKIKNELKLLSGSTTGQIDGSSVFSCGIFDDSNPNCCMIGCTNGMIYYFDIRTPNNYTMLCNFYNNLSTIIYNEKLKYYIAADNSCQLNIWSMNGHNVVSRLGIKSHSPILHRGINALDVDHLTGNFSSAGADGLVKIYQEI